MPVACQSRDLARPQARIPVRVTKKQEPTESVCAGVLNKIAFG